MRTLVLVSLLVATPALAGGTRILSSTHSVDHYDGAGEVKLKGPGAKAAVRSIVALAKKNDLHTRATVNPFTRTRTVHYWGDVDPVQHVHGQVPTIVSNTP